MPKGPAEAFEPAHMNEPQFAAALTEASESHAATIAEAQRDTVALAFRCLMIASCKLLMLVALQQKQTRYSLLHLVTFVLESQQMSVVQAGTRQCFMVHETQCRHSFRACPLL